MKFNKIRRAFRAALSLLFVPRCVCCGERLEKDDLFCTECFNKYLEARNEECPFCHQRIDLCLCPTSDMADNGISKYLCILPYGGGRNFATDKSAYVLKREHNKRLIKFYALELAKRIKNYTDSHKDNEYAITYAPRTKVALKKYGYDQSLEIAKEISKILSLDFYTSIVNSGKSEQKNMNKKQRMENTESSLSLADNIDVTGVRFFLIDDVVTTGSTAIKIKNILKKAGAKEVILCSVFLTLRGKC